MTLQERFVASLTARGYRHSTNSAHYMVFTGPAHTPLFDTEPPTMRYLVGKAGALRYTKNRLSESHPLSDRAKNRLLDETRRPSKAADDELVI